MLVTATEMFESSLFFDNGVPLASSKMYVPWIANNGIFTDHRWKEEKRQGEKESGRGFWEMI